MVKLQLEGMIFDKEIKENGKEINKKYLSISE